MSVARTALTDVRVFDGHRILDPATVVIDGALIGDDQAGAREVDGGGAVLLPGLIDTHVHITGPDSLENLAAHGVTTGLSMGFVPAPLAAGLRGVAGVADLRESGVAATAPGSRHAHIPGWPADGLVHGPEDAERFVVARVAEGSDFIKIIAEAPGPVPALDQPTLNALAAAARAHGRLSIAHASAYETVEMARRAGVDVITHVPLDRPIDETLARGLAADGRTASPTLTMMEAVAADFAKSGRPGADFAAARASVTALHQAGVPILAGTDANTGPGTPANVPHGSGLHHELELLVQAGLSPLDALRAATVLPARHFGLADRGAIAPGLRADLLLVDGDPLADITATSRIRRIWCAGVERGVA